MRPKTKAKFFGALAKALKKESERKAKTQIKADP
jgi:hypothetical protein